MSRDWESIFRSWAKPPSSTEDDKCNNAQRMIKEAIFDSPILSGKDVVVIPQGSYQNNTNVRLDSDVDICICCRSTVKQEFCLAPSRNNIFTRFQPATYLYSHLKNDVYEALKNKFGNSGISRGDKAIEVHENTYRINADVIPALQLILYLPSGGEIYGTCFVTDSDRLIYNFPEQHRVNGINKNKNTNGIYKQVVRIVKHLRNEMSAQGIKSADAMSSFLIESLVFIVPDLFFSGSTYFEIVNNVIVNLWGKTTADQSCDQLREINNIKFLFGRHQAWTQFQVNAFMLDAYSFIKNN